MIPVCWMTSSIYGISGAGCFEPEKTYVFYFNKKLAKELGIDLEFKGEGVKEKGIDESIIYEAMELALTSAYKKNYHSLSNVRPDINRETGEIHIYSFKTVVPDDYEELTEEVTTKDEDGNEIVIDKPCVYDERIHIKLHLNFR